MTFLSVRQREAAIRRFYDGLGIATLSRDQNAFAAKRSSLDMSPILAASRTDPPADTPLFETDAFGIQLLAAPSVEVRQPVLVASSRAVALLETPGVQLLFESDREISVRVERLVFDAPRREPQNSLFGRSESVPTIASRLENVERAERPPGLERRDLKDRLRWILTPPINELLSDPDLSLPKRPFGFQLEGIKWLYDRENALLADEMGLGKTMQAIIAARLLWRANLVKHILVICPKSLISNWKSELKTWWPNVLPNLNVYEAGRDRRWFLKLATANVTIKLINYESLSSERDWLRDNRVSHDLVIIDEAQRIKNAGSKTAQSVKCLRGLRCWALTGTPLENRIDDVVSIFEFVRPGTVKAVAEAQVAKRIRPFMLRRRTDDPKVKVDLKDRIDQDVALDLCPEQRETYRRTEDEGVVELNAKGDSVTVTHVFQLIHRLRQLCNFDPSTGSSVKLDLFCEEFEEIADSGKKALLFSQFTSEEFGLKRIGREIEDRKWQALQLHGEVPSSKREKNIEAFQNDPGCNLLLLNYQVGGVGLNLQAATYVYLFDRWWNPAVEDQAVKRAHRIGQNQTVIVRRFYCRDTIEERILEKLAEKRRLFTTVIDEHRAADTVALSATEISSLVGLSEEEIFSLFNLKVRPRRSTVQPAPVHLNLGAIDSTQFEELVARVYEAQGYSVQRTGASHDGGVDVIASRESGGARDRIAVQCKHQKDNVGRPVLQQLWGVVSADPSFTRADLVTSANFSREARAFAIGKRVTLIERETLIRLVHEHQIAVL
ncbi:MAG: hypothetical protein AMXMBFR47_41040 [Planctomycetota bacterium]